VQKTPNHTLSPLPCPQSLADVDLFSTGAQEHWYEAYDILHREAPVHRLEGEGLSPATDGFILSKYQDINTVVKDPVRFPPLIRLMTDQILAKGKSENPFAANPMVISMATLRPDDRLYRTHRQELTDPWVGMGSARHADKIREISNSLIDDWIDNDQIEFISQFARPLPQRVTAHVLGFPQQDTGMLADWGTAQVMAFVHGKGHRNIMTPEQTEQQAKGLVGFDDYIRSAVADKRRQPQDDMISFLTEVTYKALDRKLTDVEICGIVYAMVLGGLETTQYALEEQAQLVCETEGLYQRLRGDRSLIRNFVEEGMRLRAPTQGLSTRITSQEEVFQGVKIPAGSLLHLRFGAANIDGDEFDCPHQVKLERKAATRHLAFSAGPRVCPGAHISRLEQQIAWECLLQRVESFDYAPGNTFQHQPGIMLGTLKLDLNIKAAS
jgi:cytochrome P450